MENGVEDPDHLRLNGKMADKPVKFYPTDPHHPHRQMRHVLYLGIVIPFELDLLLHIAFYIDLFDN